MLEQDATSPSNADSIEITSSKVSWQLRVAITVDDAEKKIKQKKFNVEIDYVCLHHPKKLIFSIISTYMNWSQ